MPSWAGKKIPKQGISLLNFQFFIRNLMVVCGMQMTLKHLRAEGVESPAWSRTDRTKLPMIMEKLLFAQKALQKSQKFQQKHGSSSKCNTVRNHALPYQRSNSLDRLWLTQTPTHHITQKKPHKNLAYLCFKMWNTATFLSEIFHRFSSKILWNSKYFKWQPEFCYCYKNLHLCNLILLVLTIHKHIL